MKESHRTWNNRICLLIIAVSECFLDKVHTILQYQQYGTILVSKSFGDKENYQNIWSICRTAYGFIISHIILLLPWHKWTFLFLLSFTRSHLVAKYLFAILDEVNDELSWRGHCLSPPGQPARTQLAVAHHQGSWIVIRHGDLPFKINWHTM